MALSPEYLNIETPENVVFGYEVAGIGSRFLAAIVDTVIITLLQLLVNTIVFILAVNFYDLSLSLDEEVFPWVLAVFGLVAFAFFWGYYIFFELLWNGQTPGKRWVGLRVLRADGTPIALSEILVRNLVRLIDFLPAYYAVGVLTMFIDRQSRRLGDLAAGTLVVHDRPAITLESLKKKPALWTYYRDPPVPLESLPVERLNAAQLQVIEEYVLRREQLANRMGLAGRILQAVTAAMEMPPFALDDPRRAEDYLVAILKAAQEGSSQ